MPPVLKMPIPVPDFVESGRECYQTLQSLGCQALIDFPDTPIQDLKWIPEFVFARAYRVQLYLLLGNMFRDKTAAKTLQKNVFYV